MLSENQQVPWPARSTGALRSTRQPNSPGKWTHKMNNRVPNRDQSHVSFAILAQALIIIGLPSLLRAQTFQTVPALAFTKAFAQAEPLPQVLTIAYTDQSTVRF